MRRPRLRATVFAALLVTIGAGLGCDGGPYGPGDTWLVEVWVRTPNAADQAILVTFQDRVHTFRAEAGFQHFQDADDGASSVLVVADWPLPAGETMVGTARLWTRSRATLPTARVVEAARSDFQMRESVADYRIRLVPIQE
jgi:hypothetical protein